MKRISLTRIFAASVLVFFLGLPAVPARAADEPYRTAADRPVDMLHIKLDLDVNLKEKTVAGTAFLDFQPLREIHTLELHAVDHEVQSVRGLPDGTRDVLDLRYENTGETLLVRFPQPVPRGQKWRIEVRYRIRDPKSGLHFFQPTQADPDVPLMVWSQGEPTHNRYWFPCLDHPNERQTTELVVRVDEGFEALSNGRLVAREETRDGRVRFHWRQSKPHVAYLVTLVVGEFAVGRDEWRGKPVLYYVPPEREADIARSFGRTVEMLEFFSERFGIEYPWEKYAQVVVEQFVIGGMENTSATTLYEGTMHDERAILDSSPDWLIAHELGHQWWGDLVTCKDWSHLWLNEGFATYCEVLWAEHKLGRDERDYVLYGKSRAARSGTALSRPIVDRRYPDPMQMFDVRVYPKGGWVLHMLRNLVGDADFFRAIQRYGTVYAYQTAETADLRQAFERLLGVSLERFFYDWTQRAGHPQLKVRTEYHSEDGLVQVAVSQTQDGEAFHFPLKIELLCPVGSENGGGGTEIVDKPVVIEKFVTEKEWSLYVPVPTRPRLVRVDPEYTLLAEIQEDKSRDWWKEQLLNAPTVAERIRAAEHFGESKSDADRELLTQCLQNDAFYGVRVEAAAALGKSGGDMSRDALIAGLQAEHPKVRRACADALGNFAEDETTLAALRQKIEAGDVSYFVEAAALTSLAKVQSSPELKPLLAALKKDSHREAIRQAALGGLGRCDESQALDVLLEWSRRGKPRRCRTAAISGIAEFLTRNEVADPRKTEAVEQVTAYLTGEGPRIRRAAVGALRDFGTAARPALATVESLALHDPDGRVRAAAKTAAERIKTAETPTKELDRLRKEIESVRKLNEELEDRLLRLEAK